MYELRDKSNTNCYKYIINPQDSPTYEVGKITDRADKYSADQPVLYFTLDDTLGVVEDLCAEIQIYMAYQNEFSKAVSQCRPMSDPHDSANKGMEALYSSAAVLYNMLYADGGALNRPEHKKSESTDEKHKYQSLVQKYKFTKLLAVEERKAIQKKYGVLRDLLGKIIDCDAYKKEINTFIGQSESIAFMGQGVLMDHMRLLMNKPDTFDADINLNEAKDKKEDKWAKKIKELTMAYLKLTNKGEDVSSPLVKLLREVVDPALVVAESKDRTLCLPETESQLKFEIRPLLEMLLGCIKISTAAYMGFAERADDIIKLENSIKILVGDKNVIIEGRKVQIGELLNKYNLESSPELIDELSRENKLNIAIRKRLKGNVNKFVKELNHKKVNRRRLLKERATDIAKQEAHLAEIKKTKNVPGWIKSKDWDNFFKKLDRVVNCLNLFFAAMKVMEDAMDENNKLTTSDYTYYALILIGGSFDLVKKGEQVMDYTKNMTDVFKLTKRMKIAKGLVKGIALDLVVFTAECVNSYRMLSMRNPRAAFYNTLSAGLSLMSGVCLTIAFCLTGIGLVILLVAAIAFAVASYYIGERVDKNKYDVWQSFLICSIFSNYYKEKTFDKNIVASIEIEAGQKYYDVAQVLYERRQDIAVNDYYYKNKEYNLQNFTEMLNLLEEMATCLEVNIESRKIVYSKEGSGNYIIPNNITVAVSYYGTTRFDAIDYFLYIDVYPVGNTANIKLPGLFGINPLSETDIITEDGKREFTLTFNIWKALHNIKNSICNNDDYVTVLVKKDLLELEIPRDQSRIIYPSNMTFTFGCRLVNSKQEKDKDAASAADQRQIRPYLPYKDRNENIYKGFKCRVGIPLPDEKNVFYFTNFYYRNIYGHLKASVGTFDELLQLELRPINYVIKDKR